MREMKRKEQLLSKTDAEKVLESVADGTLNVIGMDGYPYGVPLNYVYKDGKIFFHSASAGHKLDAIKENSAVSFTVVDKNEVLPDKFNTLFSSVIAFGKARLLTDDDEKRAALVLIAEKYSGEYMEAANSYIDTYWDDVAVVEIHIDHLSGKVASELL